MFKIFSTDIRRQSPRRPVLNSKETEMSKFPCCHRERETDTGWISGATSLKRIPPEEDGSYAIFHFLFHFEEISLDWWEASEPRTIYILDYQPTGGYLKPAFTTERSALCCVLSSETWKEKQIIERAYLLHMNTISSIHAPPHAKP